MNPGAFPIICMDNTFPPTENLPLKFPCFASCASALIPKEMTNKRVEVKMDIIFFIIFPFKKDSSVNRVHLFS